MTCPRVLRIALTPVHDIYKRDQGLRKVAPSSKPIDNYKTVHTLAIGTRSSEYRGL
jgi:hypothetical protein